MRAGGGGQAGEGKEGAGLEVRRDDGKDAEKKSVEEKKSRSSFFRPCIQTPQSKKKKTPFGL